MNNQSENPFDDDFFNKISKFDLSFNEYFHHLGGVSIKISSLDNELQIIGLKHEVISKLTIAKSARGSSFELNEMLSLSPNIGEKKFGVLLNGFNNKDWLFAVDVAGI